jgi:hypothetical protein
VTTAPDYRIGLTWRMDAGSGLMMRTSTSSQVGRGKSVLIRRVHPAATLAACVARKRLHRLLATVRDPSPAVTYAPIGSALYPHRSASMLA